MKEETANNTQNALINSLNFNTKLTCNLSEILQKYVSMILEYTDFISEKVNIKNKKYYDYLYNRGLDTISHVFLLILFYTKNLDITYYHSQKAFYFYVEFIEQILDVQHSFLNLTSRDATMFVYKKTVYEINNEYRKMIDNSDNNSSGNNNNNGTSSSSSSNNSISSSISNDYSITKDSKFDLLNSYIEIYKMLIRLDKPKVIEISEIINKTKGSSSYMQKILNIVHIFAEKMMNDEQKNQMYPVFILLLKKLFTEQLDNKILTKLRNKLLLDEEFTETILCNIIPSSI
jgi:hypothetical protein